MNNYTSTNLPSPKQGFIRFSLFCEEELILEIDHKYDAQSDLQIYLNSSFNSKNPANNNFPKEWNSYKLNNNKFFEKTDKTYFNLNHISFHPRPHFNWENQSRNTKITFENNEVFIAGENKDKEFFPLINIVREKSNGFVEHIALIQNFQADVRRKINEKNLREFAGEELKNNPSGLVARSYADPISDELDAAVLKDFENKNSDATIEFFKKLGKDENWLKEFEENFKKEFNKNPWFSQEFDFDKNYTIRVSTNKDLEFQNEQKKFFNVSKLDFILLGNMDFSAKTDIPAGKEVLIGYFER